MNFSYKFINIFPTNCIILLKWNRITVKMWINYSMSNSICEQNLFQQNQDGSFISFKTQDIHIVILRLRNAASGVNINKETNFKLWYTNHQAFHGFALSDKNCIMQYFSIYINQVEQILTCEAYLYGLAYQWCMPVFTPLCSCTVLFLCPLDITITSFQH